MTNEIQKTPLPSPAKGFTGLLASVLIPLAIILWLALRPNSPVVKEPGLPTTHPLLGEIFETTAVNGAPVLMRTGLSNIWTHTRTIVPLTLGPNVMTWLKEDWHGQPAGCLYAWDPARVTSNVWSFAPCAKSSLEQVTKADLQASFCSAGEDTKGTNTFGSRWGWSERPGTAAVWVQPGQVVLAKHVRNPSVVYVLEMTKQEPDSLRVRYVTVAQ